MKTKIYWDFYERFKKQYWQTHLKLSNSISNEINIRITKGDDYILAQDIVNRLNLYDFQSQVDIPDNILRSLAGMELYKLMENITGWKFEETRLVNRDYNQTIYFKVKGANINVRRKQV